MRHANLIAGAGIAAAGALAAVGGADIVGTAHDFSTLAWSGGEICKPCHTPHFADPTVDFLWAHSLSALSYTLYDGSVTGPSGIDSLDQRSRMCLSCHDGSVALNNYYDSGGPPEFMDEAFQVGAGGNLADDHPIGKAAEYPIAGSIDFNAPTLSSSGLYGFGGDGNQPDVPLYPFLSAEAVVSCSSCHDVHGKAGTEKLLRINNNSSALCLVCHIK
jgi:predicted CXXCH cytochrome family protein